MIQTVFEYMYIFIIIEMHTYIYFFLRWVVITAAAVATQYCWLYGQLCFCPRINHHDSQKACATSWFSWSATSRRSDFHFQCFNNCVRLRDFRFYVGRGRGSVESILWGRDGWWTSASKQIGSIHHVTELKCGQKYFATFAYCHFWCAYFSKGIGPT